MAAWSITWGIMSVGGVLLAARLAFGGWLPVRPMAIAVAAFGITLSAVVHVVLQQWEIERFGYPDADFVGITAGLFAVLIGLATSGFAVLVAPASGRSWPIVATLAGSLGVLGIGLSNLPGLRDGLPSESWPLALWLAASAAYAVVVGSVAVGRVRG